MIANLKVIDSNVPVLVELQLVTKQGSSSDQRKSAESAYIRVLSKSTIYFMTLTRKSGNTC